MKKLILLPLFFLFFTVNAQEVRRIELGLPPIGDVYHPMLIGKEGVLLLGQNAKDSYVLLKFNANLDRVWQVNGTIDEKLSYATNFYDGKNVYILFTKYESNVYQVVKVYLEAGFVENFNIYSVDKIQISEFRANKNKIYIGGKARNQPIILYTDIDARVTKVLPIAIKAESDLQSMEIDTTTGRLSTCFSIKKGKVYELLTKTYAEDGQQEADVEIAPDPDLVLLNGRLTTISDSVNLMVGTYGFRNMQTQTNSASQGLFFSKLINYDPVNQNYYSFTDFRNFFNFLSDKDREKMERKIDKQRDKGNDLRLNYRLLMHDIVKKDGKYILVAEVVSPEYRYANSYPYNSFGRTYMGMPMLGTGWGWGSYALNPYNSWGYGGRSMYNGYNNGQVLEGWNYTHAIVAGFDANGTLLWDNIIEIKGLKTKTLVERVKASINGEQVTMSYIQGGKIYQKMVQGSKPNNEIKEMSISTGEEGEQIRRSENEELSFWYDDYTLTWGTQRIVGEDGKRNVFYLNKIKF
jgi:hypothetical protein